MGMAPTSFRRRDRLRPLRVVVSDTEREAIQARAQSAGLSVSAYLRSLGIGSQPRANTALNHEQVLALAKVNADQGRLGGLLKMWLVDRPGRGASETEVRRLLREIQQMQEQLADVVERL